VPAQWGVVKKRTREPNSVVETPGIKQFWSGVGKEENREELSMHQQPIERAQRERDEYRS